MAEPAAAAEAAHVAGQAAYFARVLPLMQSSVTPEVHQRLQAVADAVPGLAAGSRVLDAGCGDGVLIPQLQVGEPASTQPIACGGAAMFNQRTS